MLIDQQTLQLIDSIVDRYMDAMIVYAAGKSAVGQDRLRTLARWNLLAGIEDESLIDRAYWVGRLRQIGVMDGSDDPHDLSLQAIKELRARLEQTMTVAEKEGLFLARRMIARELSKHKETVKGIISDLILTGNYQFRNATASPHAALEEALLRRESVAKIAIALRDKTVDIYRDWRRVAVTELTNTMNAGAADQMTTQNKGLTSDQIYVYKAIPLDTNTCAQCIRLYLEADKATPKVYPLSELIANGTNKGLKQADWKAVVGATHPNCRGTLLQLANGWGFEPGSPTLKFYGPPFIWYRDKLRIFAEHR